MIDATLKTKLDTCPLIGTAGGCDFFAVEEDVLVSVPHYGMRDDKESARAHIDLIHGYFTRLGQPGAVIVLLDPAINQDPEARHEYRHTLRTDLVTGTALVGGTLLTRSMAALIVKLVSQQNAVAFFGSFRDAMTWARDQNVLRATELHARSA